MPSPGDSDSTRHMARTLNLYQLVSQPESLRDDEWERAFFQALLEAKVEVDSDQSRTGPDGWPYLHVKITMDGKEPVTRIISWLSQRGIGLTVNAHKMVPDYIFTYGMIWNFVETGQFLIAAPADQNAPTGQVDYKKEDQMIFGPPSERYLPPYARDLLRSFLQAQGVQEPKILVASTADYKNVDLIVSLNSLGNPPQREHASVAEAIGWFLPSHYSVVLAEEQSLPPFVKL